MDILPRPHMDILPRPHMDILAMTTIILGRVYIEAATVQVTTTAMDDGSGEEASLRSTHFASRPQSFPL
jgi:hypothetical protein